MPSGNIKAYDLDSVGVIVDTDAVMNTDPNTLTKAQNAIPEVIGEQGTLRKRPGLKPFNLSAGSGVVLGGVGVPAFLGSAGPDFENPFPVTPAITVAKYTHAVPTDALGGTFADSSDEFAFDPLVDVDEPVPVAPTANETETSTGDTGSSMWTLFIVGDGTSWYAALNTTLTLHIDSNTTYTNPQSMVLPIASLRGAGPLVDWNTGGSTSALRGRVIASADQALYYAENGA